MTYDVEHRGFRSDFYARVINVINIYAKIKTLNRDDKGSLLSIKKIHIYIVSASMIFSASAKV
jgi:hypothetical protein